MGIDGIAPPAAAEHAAQCTCDGTPEIHDGGHLQEIGYGYLSIAPTTPYLRNDPGGGDQGSFRRDEEPDQLHHGPIASLGGNERSGVQDDAMLDSQATLRRCDLVSRACNALARSLSLRAGATDS